MWYTKLDESDDDEYSFCENLSDEDYEKSFYCAIKPAVKVGKVFGLFPININSKQPHEINFKWKCYRTFTSIIFILWSALAVIFNTKNQVQQGELNPANVVGIIFFGVCFTISIVFLEISRKFRYLMINWTRVESIFSCEKYDFPETRWKLRKRISFFLWTFILGAVIEHALSISVQIYMLHFEITHCNITEIDVLEVLITKHLQFMITNLPFSYNHFIGIFAEFMNISITFWWNYIDLFIILISMGLSELFEKITRRIKCAQTIVFSDSVWEVIRSHHVEISELIKIVNKIFGFAFIIACCNDGYFILIQMLNITTSLPFFISSIYFWFSLLFLIMRASLMITFASKVHESAREPITIIRGIPTDFWCSELQRFFDQIKLESNANSLSGKNFFFMNKRLLFSIAGALVTYELVLIQFDGKKIQWQDMIDCNAST